MSGSPSARSCWRQRSRRPRHWLMSASAAGNCRPSGWRRNTVFDGPAGTVSLLDMFEGRLQLIVQHFMFDPAWDEGCPVCSYQADSVGNLAHLHARNTTFAAVSRAPIGKIEPFRQRMGWSFPWYSSLGSDFNYDFHVTHDEERRADRVELQDQAGTDRRRHAVLRPAGRAGRRQRLLPRRRHRPAYLLGLSQRRRPALLY